MRDVGLKIPPAQVLAPGILHVQSVLAEPAPPRHLHTRHPKQTAAAKAAGASNCPLCAHGSNANKNRIYKANEMDADHVTAWSKGGATTLENCQMLCVTHNRSKGNR